MCQVLILNSPPPPIMLKALQRPVRSLVNNGIEIVTDMALGLVICIVCLDDEVKNTKEVHSRLQ